MTNPKPLEILKHGTEAISRIMVAHFFPAVSQTVNEFQNFSRNIKIDRLIEFTELFESKYQQCTGDNISINHFKSEDLVDIFELIINKVCSTKSEYKRSRFADLLLNQTIAPLKDQIIFKYASLLTELNDIQIIILHSISDLPFHTKIDFDNTLRKYNKSESEDIDFNTVKISFCGMEIVAESKEITFYVKDLISKGLIDHKVDQQHEIPETISGVSNSNNNKKIKTLTNDKYMLSKIGLDFLNLIKEKEI